MNQQREEGPPWKNTTTYLSHIKDRCLGIFHQSLSMTDDMASHSSEWEALVEWTWLKSDWKATLQLINGTGLGWYNERARILLSLGTQGWEIKAFGGGDSWDIIIQIRSHLFQPMFFLYLLTTSFEDFRIKEMTVSMKTIVWYKWSRQQHPYGNVFWRKAIVGKSPRQHQLKLLCDFQLTTEGRRRGTSLQSCSVAPLLAEAAT